MGWDGIDYDLAVAVFGGSGFGVGWDGMGWDGRSRVWWKCE